MENQHWWLQHPIVKEEIGEVFNKLERTDVDVTHIRETTYDRKTGKFRFLSRGGITLVAINFPGVGVIIGKACCHDKDLFCKKIGRNEALKQAFSIYLRKLKAIEKKNRISAELKLL